ncbi:sporulation integral membrane protein YlbJ [Abyssisolibacter fermentans]|uniref:sporulation integral membrane protein YlbJ n=1 Tax=Abyssisolibacter fermentans TaxID=1766203 RepID=UPI00082FE5FE|nr:sporulation integral membrane protein YlbJ [Abyssisolibacter fermentans]
MINFLLLLLSFTYIFNHFKKKYAHWKKAFFFVLVIHIVVLLAFLILLQPETALKAGVEGVNIWLNIILPSLFPFFVCSEILINLGIADFIGTLLEPIIKPIFNVPGQSAYVFSISIASGYPIGAKNVANLLSNNEIDTISGQKILSFCSTSGPLFLIGSVSIGMLNNPSLGTLFAISHYIGALGVGLIFKFYYDFKYKNSHYSFINNISLNTALDKLIQKRRKNDKSIGELLSLAVIKSMNTILMVGGFIILYSIITNLLLSTKIFDVFSSILCYIIPSISKDLIKGLLCGFIEMTNGCKIIAAVGNSSYVAKLSAISFIIGWSGLSIHSQVISIIKETKLKLKPYIAAKFAHGLLSAVLTLIIYKSFYSQNDYTIVSKINTNVYLFPNNWLNIFVFSLKLFAVVIITLLLFGVVYNFITSKINKRN